MTDIVYCPPDVDCPCYAKLVSENATLRATNERLRALYDEAMTCWHQTTAQCQIAVDQTTTLLATNERLRAALEKITKYPRGGLMDTPEKLERDEMIGIARAALAQEKPNDR